MFSEIGDLQNYPFAQMTPSPQRHDDSGDSDQSSSNGPSSNADDGEGSDGYKSSEPSSAIDDSESQDMDGLRETGLSSGWKLGFRQLPKAIR